VHANLNPRSGPALIEKRAPRKLKSPPLRSILPGIITGAANDDPCAVGTYAQAGAAFGFAFLWTAPLTFPMMAATVYLCSKLSLLTGKGIAGIIRDYYPRWLLYTLIGGVFVANIIEAGADIGAIAAALRLFLPVPVTGITVAIAIFILAIQAWGSYQLLQKIFAGLALALFAYVGAAFLAKPHAGEFIRATIVPHFHFTREYLAMLVALIGTRLSPYVYFWESSQKVEQHAVLRRDRDSGRALRSSAWDANVGMFFSNLIMYFVILCTAATLFHSGHRTITDAAQAAEALRPLAGPLASVFFALGILGAGALAVPVLTTGPAHAIAEIFGWSHGLKKSPQGALEFYAVIALSTGVAIGLGISGINVMSALYWASLVMGILAAPLMIVLMLAVTNSRIIGQHSNGKWLKRLGWATTAAVTTAALALIWSWIF
jgi:NRAMP (natural resistance-associated macrophage protein)-like metal ion transporter